MRITDLKTFDTHELKRFRFENFDNLVMVKNARRMQIGNVPEVYKVQTFLGVLAVLRKCMKSASCGHKIRPPIQMENRYLVTGSAGIK
jgi:hypothetical protein